MEHRAKGGTAGLCQLEMRSMAPSILAGTPRHPNGTPTAAPHAGIQAELCSDATAEGRELGGLEVEVQLRFEGLALHVQVGHPFEGSSSE